MALETEPLCGAAPGEHNAERINRRNGYRDRDWHTCADTVELRIFPNEAAIEPPTTLQLSSGKRWCDVILYSHDMAKVFESPC